jgi:cytochrome b
MAAWRPDPAGERQVSVWDPLVRTAHWIVALGCIANLSFLRHADELHEWVGYAALASVLTRIVWGFVGRGHAHFRDFVPSPRSLIAYAAQLLRRREPRYLGHNPAGAAMMIVLMMLVVVCGITGWMLGLDAFWGDSDVEAVHVLAADAIMVLAVIHVAGAVVESIRHRENLVVSMITGRKRAPSGSDICHLDHPARR